MTTNMLHKKQDNLVENNYKEPAIAFMEAMWGDGFMSSGGPKEVARLLSGIEIAGKSVLDIGSGAGGVTISLVRDLDAASVIGIDIEVPVCARATELVHEAGLQDRIDIRMVVPGPFPLEDESLDIVFSREVIGHISDKTALAHDIYRILKPGGWFVGSDWMISHDGPPSPEMENFLELEDLGDDIMFSPLVCREALENAGFVDISFENRNRWSLAGAREELARLTGPERTRFEAEFGKEHIDWMTDCWKASIPVLESGEHCPHHFRCRKPE